MGCSPVGIKVRTRRALVVDRRPFPKCDNGLTIAEEDTPPLRAKIFSGRAFWGRRTWFRKARIPAFRAILRERGGAQTAKGRRLKKDRWRWFRDGYSSNYCREHGSIKLRGWSQSRRLHGDHRRTLHECRLIPHPRIHPSLRARLDQNRFPRKAWGSFRPNYTWHSYAKYA